jgi:excisionase family DNA binding protein
MPRKKNSTLSIRLGLSVDEAAEFLSIGVTLFLVMVADGRMPRPRMLNGRKVWDIDEVTRAFRALPREGGEPVEVDTWADVVRA